MARAVSPSPPSPSLRLAASASLPASAASVRTTSRLAASIVRRHVSATVSDPAWNSDSSRIAFTSSGGGSMIRSNP